jgi:hypothetical protein
MSSDDDYLWDKKGAPSRSTQALEDVLREARFSESKTRGPPARRRRWPVLATAFAVAAAAAMVLTISSRDAIRVEFASGETRRLAVDEWIENKNPATLELARKIGVVTLRPDSKVRVRRVDRDQQRLELARGSLRAVVLAPPRLFIVDTPSAAAIDLGCEYTLDVQHDGATRLHVMSGKVELEGGGKTATVYARMWTQTRGGQAPQVAIDDRASIAFVSAVQRLDHEPGVLSLLLSQAERSDAVTLFQLSQRATGPARAALEARLEELVPRAGATDAQWLEACVATRG